MNIFKKSVANSLFFIISIISFNVTAEVHKLNSGTCWLEELPKGAVKVADFNKASAVEFSPDFLKQKMDLIQTEMERFGEERVQIKGQKTYFYCSEGGNSFVFNINYDEVSVCSWFFLGGKEKGNSNIEYFSHNGGDKGPCWGHEPGVLFVRLTEESFLNGLYKELNSVHWGDIIENVEYFSRLTLKVKLYEKFYFREHEVKKKLEVRDRKTSKIKEIFFNHIMRIGGEFRLLKNWSSK
jgi:hypothetical protein